MSKTEIHSKAEKIRSEISSQSGRRNCLEKLASGAIEQAKADIYLQNLAKQKFLSGCEREYRKLSLLLLMKRSRTQHEKNFVAFCEKNQLIG